MREWKCGRLARWTVGRLRKQLQPARVDVGSVVLRVEKIGDETNIVGGESRALDQRRQVTPGVFELPRRIRRELAGLEVDSSNTGGEEEITHLDQVGRHRGRDR